MIDWCDAALRSICTSLFLWSFQRSLNLPQAACRLVRTHKIQAPTHHTNALTRRCSCPGWQRRQCLKGCKGWEGFGSWQRTLERMEKGYLGRLQGAIIMYQGWKGERECSQWQINDVDEEDQHHPKGNQRERKFRHEKQQ